MLLKLCPSVSWDLPGSHTSGQLGAVAKAGHGSPMVCLRPPSPLQPASWASTSQPQGTSCVPGAPHTATLQPLLLRPAAVTSATTVQPWTHHLQLAPVSTNAAPRHPQGQHWARTPTLGPATVGKSGPTDLAGPRASLDWGDTSDPSAAALTSLNSQP